MLLVNELRFKLAVKTRTRLKNKVIFRLGRALERSEPKFDKKQKRDAKEPCKLP